MSELFEENLTLNMAFGTGRLLLRSHFVTTVTSLARLPWSAQSTVSFAVAATANVHHRAIVIAPGMCDVRRRPKNDGYPQRYWWFYLYAVSARVDAQGTRCLVAPCQPAPTVRRLRLGRRTLVRPCAPPGLPRSLLTQRVRRRRASTERLRAPERRRRSGYVSQRTDSAVALRIIAP